MNKRMNTMIGLVMMQTGIEYKTIVDDMSVKEFLKYYCEAADALEDIDDYVKKAESNINEIDDSDYDVSLDKWDM
ncbi:hypothetical protein [Metabacillus sp. 22489]|uniref:hypothetical protein n=1 Tax=Metabacillus sp. 22489 TaxID=3453928 RepID=UPI003F827521